jgi:hypothetical protein
LKAVRTFEELRVDVLGEPKIEALEDSSAF